MNKTNYIILGVGAVIIVLGAIVFLNNKKTADTSLTTDNSNTSDSTTPTSFKDGTYTAEGDYMVHIGPKHIDVTLTLKNGVITTVDVKNEADDGETGEYQDRFISGYKTQVIGKNITQVHVTKVSGSSLTPQGFNDALAKIEAQAKM